MLGGGGDNPPVFRDESYEIGPLLSNSDITLGLEAIREESI